MAYCTQCGSPASDESQVFCGSCGKRMQAPIPIREISNVPPTTTPAQASGLSHKEKAKKWVNGYSVTGAGVAAAAIIPGTTSMALFTLETTMVLHIGRIYRGQQFTKEDAAAVVGAAGFMGTVGWGSKVAMEGLNFLPGIGWLIKGGIAGSVIKTLGELIIKYFESIEHQN